MQPHMIGLIAASQGAGNAAALAAQLTSLVIRDATALDPDGSAVGIDGNGWIAEVVVPSALVADATFDPTKITLTVTDPGYDATGAATTVTRTITGGAVIRRQYPNEASKLQTQSGSDVLVRFSLSDDIFAGTTVTGVSAAAGFFGTKTAGSVASVTNGSTRTYPKPMFAWLNLQQDRATGSSYSIEAVAYHRYARSNRQVACIQFIAQDAQGTPNVAATQTVTTTALSSIQTKGQVVEAYKASIPLTSLTQADVCQVNAKVYPWLGDSTAVLDLSTDGFAWPSQNPQTKLRFLNDKNGTYGGAIAYVKAGAGGTPQVSLTAATARANPYATIDLAMAAIKVFNNANRSHNDHSGATVYFMDDGAGGAVAHACTSTIGTTSGNCLTYWKPDPLNTAAVSLVRGTSAIALDKLCCQVDLTVTTSQIFDGASTNNNFMIALENCNLTVSTSFSNHWAYRTGLTPMRNVTIKGSASSTLALGLAAAGAVRNACPLALGVVYDAAFNPTTDLALRGYAVIGCSFFRTGATDNTPATDTAMDTQDGDVWANNKFMKLNTPFRVGDHTARSRGCALVQNVFECSTASPGKAAEIAADGTSVAITNMILQYNSFVGERLNLTYNDVVASVGLIKRATLRHTISEYFNSKSDTYLGVTTATGRVGNHRLQYQVGASGNVNLGGSQDAGPVGSASSWLGMYWPSDSNSNIGAGNVTFTDNKGVRANGGVTTAGMGTYTLTGGTNGAYNRVAAGDAGLAFDMAGVARLNNGTGAAGAYERTV